MVQVSNLGHMGFAAKAICGLFLVAAPAGAAVNVNFENYPLGPVSSGSPDVWALQSGDSFSVTDTNPIAGNQSLQLADGNTLLAFPSEVGIVHAEYRIRPGTDANSLPRAIVQVSATDGLAGVEVQFEYFGSSPNLGYHNGNSFTWIPGGYVVGNDHLVSMDIDVDANTYNLTITDLTANTVRLSLTGNGTRGDIANIGGINVSTFNQGTSITMDNILVVPEPASAALIGGAICLLAGSRRRRLA